MTRHGKCVNPDPWDRAFAALACEEIRCVEEGDDERAVELSEIAEGIKGYSIAIPELLTERDRLKEVNADLLAACLPTERRIGLFNP